VEINSRSSRITRKVRQELRDTGKVIEGVYQNRREIEPHLLAWPQTRFPLLAITAKAGGGKTSMLNHLADEWEQGGHSVLLLRAQFLKKQKLWTAVQDQLSLKASVTPAELTRLGLYAEKPLLIVLDGLNEHPEPGALLVSILETCQETGPAGPIKVLFSYRAGNDAWLEIGKEQEGLFLPPVEEQKDAPAAGEEKPPVTHLPPFDLVEIESCWQLHAQREPNRFQPDFAFTEAHGAGREFTGLLRNPLLLRIFLEVHHGRSCPTNLTRLQLFEGYFDLLAQKTLDEGRFLTDVARLCLEQGTGILQMDDLFQDPRTSPTIRLSRASSPYRRLLSEGVLVQGHLGAAPTVSFLVEALLEYVAARGRVSDGLAREPAQVADLLRDRQDIDLVRNTCQMALEIQAPAEGPTFLAGWIDLEGREFAELAGPALAQLVLEAENPAKLAEILVANPTENDIVAV
jgi:hypothetical protein